MTIDVEDVATDVDLTKYTLGNSNLQDLLPDEWAEDPLADPLVKSAAIARSNVLREVLDALANRVPPIREADLTTPSELKTVVCYGTLAYLYNGAIRHDDSPNVGRAKRFSQMYADALAALKPTVLAGVAAPARTIRLSRG